MDAVNAPGASILPYLLQRALVRNLVVPAGEAQRADLMQLWAGQNASSLKYSSASALLKELVDGVTAILEPRTPAN